FLAAGRVCGRYVICVGDVANNLSIIALVGAVEIYYKVGFALAFWQRILVPLTTILGLLGWCIYRFRETRSMSLGQFLEMRYSRSLRIFAASLRSVSEMLANMIMPAIAARFFIVFLDLPHTVHLFGLAIPTFMLIVTVALTVALLLICMGGTLALIVTDAIQGMMFFPIVAVFVVFILSTFSWSNEIVPVMMDRVPGENFLNPYDLSELRDFNILFVVVLVFNAVFHKASWMGGGTYSAAKTPHEQKMAGILGTWRTAVIMTFYVLVAITVIVVMNHRAWSPQAKVVREMISGHISEELIQDDAQRMEFDARINAVPIQEHQIGTDAPLSQDENLDKPVLTVAHETFKEFEGEAAGNAKFQQYRTLFHQLMLGGAMREILPVGILGLFLLLLILAMISTDDTRIYSSAITITQDVIVPLRKKPFTPEKHLWVLRLVSIGVGVFFFCGSFFMAQLDYINLFVTLMVTMWMGGCAPVMIFGLYSRFGTTAGAFASLISGMGIAGGGILVKRNWAATVYPWLESHGWVEPVGNFLAAASRPLNPYVVWEMNPVKFPINSIEYYLITMFITLTLYCLVSLLTMKEPFNLDRMLHRGIYNVEEGDEKERFKWSLHTVFSKLIGITKEYSRGDKVIVWAVFSYSMIYYFLFAFLGVVVWNAISPWPVLWWSRYFFVVFLGVPSVILLISTVWFFIGGVIDLRKMFRDLEARVANPLDNGRVDGHVSVVDKAQFEKAEHSDEDSKAEKE
ncbi:MAG: sodium:panthothenate symporter, partial [Verrucomicrobiota bacterium]